MQPAAVSEIKTSLSESLGKVKGGEDIIITERGRPIARIIPLRRDPHCTGRLEHLEKKGLVKIGMGGIPDDFWNFSRPQDPEGNALAALLSERDGGR